MYTVWVSSSDNPEPVVDDSHDFFWQAELSLVQMSSQYRLLGYKVSSLDNGIRVELPDYTCLFWIEEESK
jgi:hypothetical protein